MTLRAGFLISALIVAAAGTPVLAQDPVEKVDRTIAFAPGGTVRLETFSGRIVIRGTRAAQVVIRGSRKARADRLKTITLETEARDTALTIKVNHHGNGADRGQFVASDLTIDLPADTRLQVKTFSAPVTVTNVTGAIEVEGFSGPIRIEGAAGDVKVKNGGGAVVVVAAPGAETRQLELETQSGRIDLRLPATVKAQLDFDTSSGNLVTTVPIDRAAGRGDGKGVSGTLNGGGAVRVRLKTGSADVHLSH